MLNIVNTELNNRYSTIVDCLLVMLNIVNTEPRRQFKMVNCSFASYVKYSKY